MLAALLAILTKFVVILKLAVRSISQRITSLIVKRITTNATNQCFILATFWTCFLSPFSSFYYNKRVTTRNNGNV